MVVYAFSFVFKRLLLMENSGSDFDIIAVPSYKATLTKGHPCYQARFQKQFSSKMQQYWPPPLNQEWLPLSLNHLFNAGGLIRGALLYSINKKKFLFFLKIIFPIQILRYR